ncbi:MAG: flagellar hook-length control protein FliK [Marmoricola sp.]|nr:flagellar hook-length control protein FliK [Marmoricola sp.]
MSTMAVDPAVSALPAGLLGNPPATDVGAATTFALAIQLALGAATAAATPVPKATPPGAATPAVVDDGDEPTDTSTGDETAVPDADTAEVGAALAALLVPPALVAASPVAAPGATHASASASVESPAPAAARSATPAGDAEQATPQPTPTGSDQATTQQVPASPDRPRRDPAPATAVAPPTTPLPQVTPPAPATPVATPAADPRPAAAHPVAAQVIPEVTKLFSTGEGVHRVTLELNPRALGEVRVVLTVRHGDVHVRLAAGSEAREALALSSGDLNRALEHIGVKDHRLTLAELPGVNPGAATQTHSDTTESRQQQAPFTGRFDTEHHHGSRQPRMGDGSTATDGTDHDHGSRTRGDRSIHEVSHVPSRGGVDLRM